MHPYTIDTMAKKLVIVESPAKGKTINKFLGDGYEVTSSYGHIRDLPSSGLAIDIENNYEPAYEISEDKEKVIKELKKLAKNASEVLLATDEDREGEAIAWHLCHALNLDPLTTKRVTYTEITEKAVKKAVDNPRLINLNLVNAQQARRVLDRLVGYELSPVLWKKVKPSLSAGRVQSVSVRIVVEREREIQQFTSTSSYKIQAVFEVKDGSKTTLLKAESNEKPGTLKDAEAFLEGLKEAIFSVKGTEKKPTKRSPSAPFTTSTLQQEASRKLSFSVLKTMMVAQRLYEAGHITYMRTDSNNLSEQALESIRQEIETRYGNKYHKRRQYSTKNESAQEAHEAIRPTYANNTAVSEDRDEQRLYELIWKRSVTSQMSDAELEKTIITIENNKNKKEFFAQGEVVLFDGFLKVYTESLDEEEDETDTEKEDVLLPPLSNGQVLPAREVTATERYSRPSARYTEASLVKKLEELGIGRPSTYAPTISTIQKRGYIVKESREGVSREYNVVSLKSDTIKKEKKTEITGAEKMKLFPTDVGGVVTDFLVENFPKILDFGFTAKVERQFDEIAEGKQEWHKMIDEFYKPFHENIETTTRDSKRATGERALGEHPDTKEPIIARVGRYGPMVQIGSTEDETKKPRFAKLKPTQSIETISIEEALDLFKLPRSLGEFEGKEVKANIGRFGPYVQHNSKFVSIKKEQDPYEISLEDAVKLIEEKRESDANKFIAEFSKEDIQVLMGRYGAYIKKGKENYKIPKGEEASTLTAERCLEIIAEADKSPKKPKRSFKKK